MTKIKKIDPLSAAKVEGLMGVVLGLIIGLVAIIFGAGWRSMMMGSYGYGYDYGMVGGFGLAAIIILPIMYGIMGFVAGGIGAWFYNLIAGWIGGIGIEFEEMTKKEEKKD